MDKILILISFILFLISIFLFIQIKNKKIVLSQQEKEKQEREDKISSLKIQYNQQEKDVKVLCDLIQQKNTDYNNLINGIKEKEAIFRTVLNNTNQLKQQYDSYYKQQKGVIQDQLEEFKQISSKAAENYFDELEKAYKHADAAHAEKISRLKTEQDKAAADLIKLKEIRKAAHEALLKQQEIKENKDNYRLKLNPQDLQDVSSLEQLRKTFHKPRVISMLIWQYYYQPIAKKQFPIILHGSDVGGIYKITNIQTEQAYIGQSVDIYKRWMEHCKAGLGIDTPVGNKLYQAMLSDGLYNFTFELLCQCSNLELNEKERYFIELYQSDLFGYNSQKGNK